jgi:hypothetical protein
VGLAGYPAMNAPGPSGRIYVARTARIIDRLVETSSIGTSRARVTITELCTCGALSDRTSDEHSERMLH